jgi:hypothetical protein
VFDAYGYGLGGSVKIGGGPSAAASATVGAQYSSQDIENSGGCQPFIEASGGEAIIVGGGWQPPDNGSWSAGLSGGVGALFTPVPPFAYDVFGGIQCGDAFYLGKW